MVSRITYAPLQKSNPIASFLRLQLFDPNWIEVKGKRIRFLDVTEKDVDPVLRKYDETKDETVLNSISLKFPCVLNIPFNIDTKSKDLLGPEDPRVVYKDGEVSKEPIVFFNMLEKGKRGMKGIFPLRKPNKKTGAPNMINFQVGGKSISGDVEKNWTPFFDTLKVGDTKRSKGFIHFVYTFDPLTILKCNLDNGRCDKIQTNFESSALSQANKAHIRGGSDLRPIPRQIIQLLNDGDHQKRLQMWVGFAKTHVKNCGCGDVTYRPNLVLLIKEDGVFRLELMTESLDFGIDVKAWNGKSTRCDRSGPNVLTPNGISFWDITPVTDHQQKGKIPLFKDYMALTFSQSDSTVEVVFLKNVLNYLFGIYEDGKYMLGDYDSDEGVLARTKKVTECALDASFKYCGLYGSAHSGNAVDKSKD
ncbi:unnamed protein product [Ambrosiozyma monospora]|uniref:Unnamed protein product n=1 Tax=Ambrosiozyma monospora TaxID=43982 RepID=A0ACB5SWZ2_AMBMO|nr:unnamed protein product [Ambrosiozyma monospora]